MARLSDTELFEVSLTNAFIRNGHLPEKEDTGGTEVSEKHKAGLTQYVDVILDRDCIVFTIRRSVLSDPKFVEIFLQVFRVVQPFPKTQKFKFYLESSSSEQSSLEGASTLTQELAMAYHNGSNGGRLERLTTRAITLDLTRYKVNKDLERIVQNLHQKGGTSRPNPFLKVLEGTKDFLIEHPLLIVSTTITIVAVVLVPILFPAGVTALAGPVIYCKGAVSWTSLYDERVPAEEIVAILQSIGAMD